MSKPLPLPLDADDDFPAKIPRSPMKAGAVSAARIFNLLKWTFVGIAVLFAGIAAIILIVSMTTERKGQAYEALAPVIGSVYAAVWCIPSGVALLAALLAQREEQWLWLRIEKMPGK